MNSPKPGARTEAPKSEVRIPFKQMTPMQKGGYLLRAVISLCTFCYIFPNLFD